MNFQDLQGKTIYHVLNFFCAVGYFCLFQFLISSGNQSNIFRIFKGNTEFLLVKEEMLDDNFGPTASGKHTRSPEAIFNQIFIQDSKCNINITLI